MKPVKFITLIQILVYCLLISTGTAQISNGWEELFNGKDFTGWRELNGKHKWEVKEGVIVGTDVHGQPNGFLCTEKEYTDFILELEVSIDTQMNNSGVQFRSVSTKDYLNGRVHGYQMEVDPKPQQWSGGIYEEGGTRQWLYTTDLNVSGRKAFKNNQWNKYRIECFGNDIRTWVNGVPISHLVDDKFPKGFIGLQLHANQPFDPPGGNQVRYRNIRIKTSNIQPSPADDVFIVNTIPNQLSVQEKMSGYTLLWDGVSTNGWHNAVNHQKPITGWEVKNNALNVVNAGRSESADVHDLVTSKQFSAFILKFDFKLTKGANSGIKYFVTASHDDANPKKALEYQIVDDSASGIQPDRALGSLAGLLAPSAPTHRVFLRRKLGDWNQGIIKVLPDNHVEYYLNGFKILEYTRGSTEYVQWISHSEYKDIPGFGISSSGNILLEGRGGEVSFRSIKIKDLSAK
jgi:Domain of Unknown Function (DUF1080)